MRILIYVLIVLLLTGLLACKKKEVEDVDNSEFKFGSPERVVVQGYNGIIMEPFITRDDTKLFFNNSNSAPAITNLHWAKKVDDLTFDYQGELQNVNTATLEGVPTMHQNNNFYFVSTRSYNTDFSTIYSGSYQSGAISNITLVSNISKNQAGWVNFDVEVSDDGNSLYFADGTYDEKGGPYTSNLVLAEKSTGTFSRSLNSDEIFMRINTSDLEYAAGISADELELYFTRGDAPLVITSIPRIYYTTRNSKDIPFKEPILIDVIDGYVEGPTLSGDSQRLYYHKKEGEIFALYMVRKLS